MTRHVLVEPGDCILAGVSGGMDSVCLLSVLRGLAPKGGFRLIVAHLNHGLRGPDADADAEFVAGLAREWDLPCVVERVDVPALARDRRLSLEEAARHARYAFLARAAGERGARFVAVAHHQDDQAETVLMHFLRGSGPAGLRGMLPLMSLTDYWSEPGGSEFDAAPLLLRPLLSVPRAEIAAYCREHGLAWRTDASNADMRHYRNRLRHELLPVLAGYNPRINEVLARTAEVMAGDYEVLETLAEEEFAELAILTVPDVVAFEQERLLLLPPGLQRALIRMSVRHLRSHLRDVNWEHVERALETVRVGAHGDAATIAGGLELRIDRGLAQIGPEGALPRSMLAPLRPRLSAAVVVPAPGALPLADGWRVEVDALGRADLPADWEYNADPWTAYLDAEAAGAALTLRPRLPGDRFRPLGLGGHTVRVNEFMINEHLPATERPDWPLLVGACGILWVCGYRVDDAAAVKPSTQHIWRVRFRR
jgi:tRNA(Ile)-lysidine synthase